MCIRDRDAVGERVTGLDEGADDYLVKPFAFTELSARVRSCLLYTSDAADERSSVDLGGRRIIKKKKKHETGRSIDGQRSRLMKHTTRRLR